MNRIYCEHCGRGPTCGVCGRDDFASLALAVAEAERVAEQHGDQSPTTADLWTRADRLYHQTQPATVAG